MISEQELPSEPKNQIHTTFKLFFSIMRICIPSSDQSTNEISLILSNTLWVIRWKSFRICFNSSAETLNFSQNIITMSDKMSGALIETFPVTRWFSHSVSWFFTISGHISVWDVNRLHDFKNHISMLQFNFLLNWLKVRRVLWKFMLNFFWFQIYQYYFNFSIKIPWYVGIWWIKNKKKLIHLHSWRESK